MMDLERRSVSMSEDLLGRYESGKKKQAVLQEKFQKFEVAQKVAAEKEESLKKELQDMGIDPEKVSSWLEEEGKRLGKDMDEYDQKAAAVEESLKNIEAEVVARQGQ
ncbi:MAG: hypothetical protein Q8P59_01475 [Dehalococcoidia bacterium]|nr:hypothetical protein [Dehalococcoidia bacterium]